ncbi:MAG: ASKHA domain-containing protein [Limnochordia bacterium]
MELVTFYDVDDLQGATPIAQVQGSVGSTILALARQGGVQIEATCAGKGRCGQCKVRVLGQLAPVTPTEEKVLTKGDLENNIRLACQAKINGEVSVWVIKTPKTHQILSSGLERDVSVLPLVSKSFIHVLEPTLDDDRSDDERLQEAIGSKGQIPLDVLMTLPGLLRRANHQVTVIQHPDGILGIEPGDTTGDLYGVAFDIGTTTVVGSLVDLNTGEELAVHSRLNGQVVYGADVISRINYTVEEEQGLRTLQEAIVTTLNEIIADLVNTAGISRAQIYQVVAVGNTCMQHLLVGVPPRYLAESPYSACFRRTLSVRAQELGLSVYPGAIVLTLPNIAGYVGADTVGVMLATSIYSKNKPTLIVDIGTNGEIALACNGRMLACSTAAGPAFEGAQITKGMRAAPGAIEAVRLTKDEVEIKVIGNEQPIGICGSGLLDAVAELLRLGLVDQTGRLLEQEEVPQSFDNIRNRLVTSNEGNGFVLAWDQDNKPQVVLTQRDIRQLQLAKGAIFSGIAVLLKEMELRSEDLEEVLLAGAFGNYLDKKSAVTVGLLPMVAEHKITSVGNAARSGAKLALVSQEMLKMAQELASTTGHIELSGRWDFQETFMEAMMFPDYEQVQASFQSHRKIFP